MIKITKKDIGKIVATNTFDLAYVIEYDKYKRYSVKTYIICWHFTNNIMKKNTGTDNIFYFHYTGVGFLIDTSCFYITKCVNPFMCKKWIF